MGQLTFLILLMFRNPTFASATAEARGAAIFLKPEYEFAAFALMLSMGPCSIRPARFLKRVAISVAGPEPKENPCRRIFRASIFFTETR